MTLGADLASGLETLLHDHAGLELPRWVIESRAKKRMTATKLSADAYLALVRSSEGASELRALVEAVRVGETRFFRHAPHATALEKEIVPILRSRGVQNVRAWSAGCATGEEAYTLALVLSQASSGKPSILGTDVSREAIAFARANRYPARALEHVPRPYRDRFVASGDAISLRADIAELVRFEVHNLATGRDRAGFHVVFCRNVLIYFAGAARKRALEALVASLVPGGFLFVGYSESLRDAAGLMPAQIGDLVLWEKRERPPAIPSPAIVTADPPPVVARAPASKAPRTHASKVLRVATGEAANLSQEITDALATPGLASLTIDLDAAPFFEDDAALVLRRARRAAESAGIALRFRATRAGAKRFVERHRLAEES